MGRLSILYGLVSVCDCLLTIFGIENGYSLEGNPYMQVMIGSFGLFAGVFLGKLIFCGMCLSGAYLIARKHIQSAELLLLVGVIVTLFAVGSWLYLIVGY